MKKLLNPFSIWGLIFIAGLLVFWPSLNVPFIYSEIYGIVNNQMLKEPSLFFERMISLRGIFDKPVTLLTFMLNYMISADPFGFHLVNFMIHFANSVLIWRIARIMNCRPWVSSLFFFFHPLSSAVVAQVYGRPYGLGLFFFLLMLLVFKSSGESQKKKFKLVLAPVYVFILMIKQSFILIPLAFISDLSIKERRLVYIMTALLSAIFLILYAIPYSLTAPVPWLDYGLSQIESLPRIFGLFLIPFNTSLIHDWAFISNPMDPIFLLGTVMIAFFVWIWIKNKEIRPFLFLFLILYLPTQNFLAKNELVREWRLYPSLAVLALLIGHLSLRLKSKWISSAFGILLVIYSFNLWQQGLIYQDGIKTWKQVLSSYPDSATGWNNLGFEWSKKNDLLNAKECFLKATQLGPHTAVYFQNLAAVYLNQGDQKRAQELRFQSQEMENLYGKNEPAIRYKN